MSEIWEQNHEKESHATSINTNPSAPTTPCKHDCNMVMKATGIQETKNETREKRSSEGTGTLVKRDPTQLTNETEGPNGTVFELPRSGKLGGPVVQHREMRNTPMI